MFSNRVITFAFLVSVTGHLLVLFFPGMNLARRPKEIRVEVNLGKYRPLPAIRRLGEQKKIKKAIKGATPRPVEKKEVVTKPERTVEPPLREEVKPLQQTQLPPEPPKEAQDPFEANPIDPAQEVMLRYQDMIKQYIEEARRYPYWARRQGWQGAVTLAFTVLADGRAEEIRILHPSGYEVLDREAVQTIRRAKPFPPILKEMGCSSLRMVVTIVFRLEMS